MKEGNHWLHWMKMICESGLILNEYMPSANNYRTLKINACFFGEKFGIWEVGYLDFFYVFSASTWCYLVGDCELSLFSINAYWCSLVATASANSQSHYAVNKAKRQASIL